MRKNIPLAIFVLLLCVSSVLPAIVLAQDAPYNIIKSNITYSYVKTETRGTNSVEFFNIDVTLRNLGTNESDDIIIEISDKDNAPVKQNHTFYPLEKKNFLFINYPILGTGDHEITIKFYPKDETKTASYNSGSETLIINKNKSQADSSIPGFEITLIITTIAIFVFLKKKNIL